MKKIVCISERPRLTKGKVYDILGEERDNYHEYYVVMNDGNIKESFYKTRFVPELTDQEIEILDE